MAVLLDGYTSLSMTPRFAAVLVVVATMAFAGAWTVGVYAADTLAGTSFVGGRVELMWDLVAATAAGVVAGVAFDAYFTYSDRVDRLESATREGTTARTGATSRATSATTATPSGRCRRRWRRRPSGPPSRATRRSW
ncbi:hypothetical protein ACFQL2_03565 [Halosegnis marinus]